MPRRSRRARSAFRDGVHVARGRLVELQRRAGRATDAWTMLRSGPALDALARRPAVGSLSPPRVAARYLAAAGPAWRQRFRSIASAENIATGPLRARRRGDDELFLGQAVAFFDGDPTIEAWSRVRRAGVRRPIDLDVLMASAAIPFIFPAAPIDGEYFGDGAMRQLAPLESRGAPRRQSRARDRHARWPRGDAPRRLATRKIRRARATCWASCSTRCSRTASRSISSVCARSTRC